MGIACNDVKGKIGFLLYSIAFLHHVVYFLTLLEIGKDVILKCGHSKLLVQYHHHSDCLE